MTPCISIIIPVYNVAKYIERCLESIIRQTYSNYEILIIDDCGNDNSMTLVKQFIESQAVNARIISHNENQGPMLARRTGYINSSGKYICFIDSDDYLPTNALETLLNAIESSECDIVSATMTITDDERVISHKLIPEGIFTVDEYFGLLLDDKVSHSLCAKLFKCELFDNPEQLPSYRGQTNGEDMILLYSLLNRSSKIKTVNISTYYYFQNHQSSTHRKFTTAQFENIIRGINYRYETLVNRTNFKQKLNKKTINVVFDLLLIKGITSESLNKLSNDINTTAKKWLLFKYLPIKKALLFPILYRSYRLRKLISI